MHDKLKAYIFQITRGLVSLKEEHAEQIERIVKQPRAFAKLSKWNPQSKLYEAVYTETTNDSSIDLIIKKFDDRKPVHFFARWDLYASDGNLKATIFTTSYTLNYLLL
jgi:hypothetical protein